MSYIVTYRGEMSEPSYRHYLLAVTRRLLAQGIAIDRVPRVRAGAVWLYAYENAYDAGPVALELERDTGDTNWHVAEVAGTPEVGPLRPVTLEIGRDRHGLGFGVEVLVARALRSRYPDAVPHEEIWIKTQRSSAHSEAGVRELAVQILPLLTGLSPSQLERFGGFEVVDPVTEAVVVPFTPFSALNGSEPRASSPTHSGIAPTLDRYTSLTPD
jgi:hypothetical protein